MCKALDDLYQDGVKKGLEQGIEAFIADYREEGFSEEKIRTKLVKRFLITLDQALDYCKMIVQTERCNSSDKSELLHKGYISFDICQKHVNLTVSYRVSSLIYPKGTL